MYRALLVTRNRAWRWCFGASLVIYVNIAIIAAVAAGQEESGVVEAESASALSVQVEAGLLTLEIDGTPLGKVLEAIGKAGEFRVELHGEFTAPVHEAFSQQPLEDAIRRLIGDRSLVMIHDDVAENDARALAEIRVIEAGGPARSRGAGAIGVVEGRAEQDGSRMPPGFERPPTKEDILLELLDREPEVRMTAALKAGSLDPGQAYGVLSDVFANEADMLVRSRAVAAATRLEGPARMVLLRRQAIRDEDPELRMQALNALAASQDRRVTSALGRALRFDPEPRVRRTAVRALQRIGGDRARGYLEIVAADFDPDVGAAVEQALAGWPEQTD